jgi:hypothetical protein
LKKDAFKFINALTLMKSLKNILTTISNISFLLIFVAFFAGKYNFPQASALQIVAWTTFAFVALMEGFAYQGKYKIFCLLMMSGVSVASLGILFKSMAWTGYEQMLVVGGISSVGAGVVFLLLSKKLDALVLKAFVVGAICFFLMRGAFL